MLRARRFLGYGLAALLALLAVVALLGLNGFVAAALGALAWFAMPERPTPLTRARAAVPRSRPR
jgi:hypothetical protein